MLAPLGREGGVAHLVAASLNFMGLPSLPGSLRLPNCPCPSSSWELARQSLMVRSGSWGELGEGWEDQGSPLATGTMS